MDQTTILLVSGVFTLAVAYGFVWSKCAREKAEEDTRKKLEGRK